MLASCYDTSSSMDPSIPLEVTSEPSSEISVKVSNRIVTFLVPKDKLNGRALINRLHRVPYWSGVLEKRAKLHREFTFKKYSNAIEFITYIAGEAQIMGHYPKIINIKNRVSVTIRSTHLDGLTEKDFILAERVNFVFERLTV